MKRLYYAGLAGLALFEIANVYFIMPLPGSQRLNSLDLAYFLHTWRWAFRGAFGLAAAAGAVAAFRARWRWVPALAGVAAAAVVWFFNFRMAADHMFAMPVQPVYLPRASSTVDESAVVVGLVRHGQAKAYPLRYLVYHHQVQDTVGGEPVLVTYCSVCRTGRVFAPLVNGRPERFRLVGMDHFNAMFEDATTGSWWRQVSGEAVTGPLKGTRLAELPFQQMTLGRWFALHPDSLVLQADATQTKSFDVLGRFERGKSEGALTRTDPASWQDKSWVVGVEAGTASKAFDWNRLRQARVINDRVGDTAVVLALARDQKSFAVFVRPADVTFTLEGEVLVGGGRRYDLAGRELGGSGRLAPARASQEFWHSWRTFHPATERGE
jgi:hypothetical protein